MGLVLDSVDLPFHGISEQHARGLDVVLIMIALWWPNQLWFPVLLEFSINHLVELPVTQTLLAQPVEDQVAHHYQNQVLT